MKGVAFLLFCAFALAISDDVVEEIAVNANGCPLNYTIHMTLTHSTYCNWFYTCENGIPLEQICPPDLVFNAKEEVCDWPINVDCEDREISPFVPDEEEDEARR